MKIISKKQMELWLGSDTTKETLITLLTELVNGRYSINAFRHDVKIYEK